jgi:hypothetical protein
VSNGACAAVGVLATLAGCGGDAAQCPLEDAGGPEGASGSDAGSGAVLVHGTFSNTTCPALNSPGASPDNGGMIDLTASISGSPADGGIPTFMWTATNGIFTNPRALDTTFHCIAVGVVTVTLTLSLGDCQQQVSLDIDCDVLAGGT